MALMPNEFGLSDADRVLKRRGHTEAALDLATLAGLPPAGVLCEAVDDEDGSMARLPFLKKFGQCHGFPLISIDALSSKFHSLILLCTAALTVHAV